MNRTSSDATRKAQWMDAFQALVAPSATGKIKWFAAIALQKSGYTPAEAAQRYLSALRNS